MVCGVWCVVCGVQAALNLAASHLRNHEHKLEDMVDECEDYVSTLRNIAIEVHTHSTVPYEWTCIT